MRGATVHDKGFILKTIMQSFGKITTANLSQRTGCRLGTVKSIGLLFSLRKKNLTWGTNISSPISRKKSSIRLEPSVI